MSDNKLESGCVVMMSSAAGMKGYGNAQCVKEVMAELGAISLYGHNQHYKIHDIAKVLEYPHSKQQAAEINELKTKLAIDKSIAAGKSYSCCGRPTCGWSNCKCDTKKEQQ